MKINFDRPSPKPTSSTDTGPPKPSPNETNQVSEQPETSTENADTASGRVGQQLTNLKTKLEEQQRKAENVREDLNRYALDRFINYIKNYEQILEKKFPGAMRVYRVFMDGVKLFGRDMIDFVKIRSSMVVGTRDIDTLSRRELELYYQMPNDMRKVGPVLLISAIPFAHYVTMPIA